MKSLIAGVPTLDGTILVGTATDGVLPQVGCYSGFVVMTIRCRDIDVDLRYFDKESRACRIDPSNRGTVHRRLSEQVRYGRR